MRFFTSRVSLRMDFGRMVWMDDDILIRHRRVVRRGSALRQEEKRKIHADAPSPRTSASAVAGVAGAAEKPRCRRTLAAEVAAVVRAKAAAVRIGDSECLPRRTTLVLGFNNTLLRTIVPPPRFVCLPPPSPRMHCRQACSTHVSRSYSRSYVRT